MNHLVSHVVVFVLGVFFGAFALRRNPVKGARTLDALEKEYLDRRAWLLSKLKKAGK